MEESEARNLLSKLRAQIDDVDERLVAVLADRFTLTRQVGAVKRDAGLSPVDAAREQDLYRRVRSRASEHGIDPDLVEALYRTLIGHVVVEHSALGEEVEVV